MLLHPGNPLFLDSKYLASDIYVVEHRFELSPNRFDWSLRVTSNRIKFQLQSDANSIDMIPVFRNDRVDVCFLEVEKLDNGIWMICGVDESKRFVCQVCIEQL